MQTLKQAREKKNLSQFRLAVKVGIAPDTIASIERGRKGTTLQTLIAICNALEVDPREIEGVIVRKRVEKGRWTVVEDPFNVSAE